VGIPSLLKLKGISRLCSFLLLLEKMQRVSGNKNLLSSNGFLGSMKEEDNDRMNLVFKYIMDHFREDVSLEKAADLSCMTSTAFCRFFKKKTRKTFSEVVIETRIGYSCKLLLNESRTISEIAYECGYNNISNFNRQFHRIMQMTPSAYLEKHSPGDSGVS
jgi:AraC-like DNA-binding protein